MESFDVFVSYAHVNNQIYSQNDKGWVSALISDLKICLNEKFGRPDSCSVWIDNALKGHKPLTPEILEKVENSAVFVLILSTGYIASEWCMRELATFEKMYHIDSSSIFVVEYEDVEGKPNILQDLKGYCFWYRDSQGQICTRGAPLQEMRDQKYYQAVNSLALELKQQIVALSKQHKIEKNDTVYIAPVPDNLIEERNKIITSLAQQNIATLPHNNNFSIKSNKKMEEVLRQCSYFIQLLDQQNHYGIPLDQYEIALEGKKPIQQWRSDLLDLKDVEDDDHRSLLEEETVMASNLATFTQTLINKLSPQEKTKKSRPASNKSIVFINTGEEDYKLAKKVSKELVGRGYFCLLPIDFSEKARVSEVRKHLNESLLYCDISLIIYADSPVTQIRKLLIHAWKMDSKREKPLETAICMLNDHTGVNEINMEGPSMHTLKCDSPLAQVCIDSFLEEIESK